MSCLNNNDVRKLPAFSEEHFEGIKWLATSMFLMGRRLAGEDVAAAKGSGRFTTENDEKCREIFDIIGKKYGVAIKQVESYIKIAMNHMLSGEDGDLKLAILEALYGENPTVEEFLAFMYVVVQKDLKEDLKKTAS